jgi:hypothetical protein
VLRDEDELAHLASRSPREGRAVAHEREAGETAVHADHEEPADGRTLTRANWSEGERTPRGISGRA